MKTQQKNTKKGNNNYKNKLNEAKKKIKIETKSFSKVFNTFNAGINEVYNMSEYLDELFGGVVTPAEVYNKLAAIATEYTPNIETRENMLWEVQISGNRCYLKTNNYIGFGWQIKTTEEGEVYNSTYTFTVNVIGSNAELEADLAENNWVQNTRTR